jgi:hypothetical protein
VRHTRTYEILFGELSLETNTQILRNSLAVSADIAKAWFQGRAPMKSRSDFEAKGKLGDEGCGCVYVYYSVENGNTKESPLYVGQTGRGIKARQHDITSPHNKKSWWKGWTHLRFLNIKVKIDRQILEFLLIVAPAPTENQSPKSMCLDDFLKIH